MALFQFRVVYDVLCTWRLASRPMDLQYRDPLTRSDRIMGSFVTMFCVGFFLLYIHICCGLAETRVSPILLLRVSSGRKCISLITQACMQVLHKAIFLVLLTWYKSNSKVQQKLDLRATLFLSITVYETSWRVTFCSSNEHAFGLRLNTKSNEKICIKIKKTRNNKTIRSDELVTW